MPTYHQFSVPRPPPMPRGCFCLCPRVLQSWAKVTGKERLVTAQGKNSTCEDKLKNWEAMCTCMGKKVQENDTRRPLNTLHHTCAIINFITVRYHRVQYSKSATVDSSSIIDAVGAYGTVQYTVLPDYCRQQ